MRAVASIRGLIFREEIWYGFCDHKGYVLVVERAGEELPAKATSRALRLSLVPNVPRVTYYPLVSSYTATPSAPASICRRTSSLQ